MMTVRRSRTCRVSGLALAIPLALGLRAGLHAQAMSGSMAVSDASPSVVNEGSTVSMKLRGTSNFNMSAFSAKLTHDPAKLGSPSVSRATGVWDNADFWAVDTSVSGEIKIAATEDTGNSGSGDLDVPQGTSLEFAAIGFTAVADVGVCTDASVGFGSSIDDNILVDTSAQGLDTGNGLGLTGLMVRIRPLGFVRGNANGDVVDGDDPEGAVTLSDGVYVLLDLFASGPAPPCLDAADANDDGRYNIVDAVTIIQYLLGNQSVSIPPPSLVVGSDTTAPSLGCATPPTVNC